MVKLGNAKAQSSISIAGNLLLAIVVVGLTALIILVTLLF